MPHATAAKDATTDLDPSEFRYVANFATVACGTFASAAALCFAYPISLRQRANLHENTLFKQEKIYLSTFDPRLDLLDSEFSLRNSAPDS